MTFDPEAVRVRREKLLLRLLFRSTDAMNADMGNRIRSRGFPDVQPSFTSVLVHIDTEGTRIGVVARRLHVTRQGASQAIQQIEKLGFIEREADPSDRRATIVRHTAQGRRLLLTAIEAMLEIEREYQEVLGAKGFDTLIRQLGKLVEHTDPSGRLESAD